MSWADTLNAGANLLGTLLWPVVVLWIVYLFRPSFTSILSNLQDLTFKAPGGLEASAKLRSVQTAVAAATATKGDGEENVQSALLEAQEAVGRISRVVTPKALGRLQGRRVLWVDDHPDNNRYERAALEQLGIEVITATSTEDALKLLQTDRYDLIISDMGRPSDSRAGYTLLDQLRSDGDGTPYIIYAGSRAARDVAEAKEHGAVGMTNRPSELIEMVVNVLQDRS
jgi:CheY-like chemotaxis protein